MNPQVRQARTLVLRFGHNPTAYQTLNPGLKYWFSPSREGFVAYTRHARTWVVAGAPICSDDDFQTVTSEFEQAAWRDGRCHVCYVCAADRLREALQNSDHHALIHMGSQPVWTPANWPAMVASNRTLRAQINRARNKNVLVTEQPPEIARTDPALIQVLAEWIASRPLPPMHFLNEANPLAGLLDDRLLFVASQQGRGVAFLLASPIPLQNGHLFDLIARAPWAPNGTAELLIDHAMRELARRGHTYATMGLVPLTTRSPLNENPAWVRPLFAWARAHGRRFYHFDGLEAFRTKLHPEAWEPLYAISNRPNFAFRDLYALGSAMVDAGAIGFLIKTGARAVRQEYRRLAQRIFVR